MSKNNPITLREAESVISTIVALARNPAGAAVFGKKRGLILSKQIHETEGRGSDVKLAEYVAGLALRLGHDPVVEDAADLHQDEIRLLNQALLYASDADGGGSAHVVDPQVLKGGIVLIDDSEVVGSVAVVGENMDEREMERLARKGKATFDAIRRSEAVQFDI